MGMPAHSSVHSCQYVHICVVGVHTPAYECARVCVRVHVSPTFEVKAETLLLLLLLFLCFPRQTIPHTLGAEPQTASWLPRLTEGTFKQSFCLSNPCYFVRIYLAAKIASGGK